MIQTLSVSPQVVALKQLQEKLNDSPWPVLPLGDPSIAEINPKTVLNGLENDSLVSFVPMEAVAEKINAFTHMPRLLSEVRKGYTCFHDNDVLWAKITPCMQNGKTAVAHGLIGGFGFGSTEFHVIRSKASSFPKFLWAVLSMPKLLYAAQGAFTGSSGHQRVPASFLEQLKIPVPPLDVQHRLIAELDTARAERDRALAEADELVHGFEPWALKTMGIKPSPPVRRNTFAIRVGRAKGRLDPFHYLPEFIEIERAITSAPHARLGDVVVFSDDTWSPSKHPESTFHYIEISGVDRRRGKAVASTIAIADAPSRARMAVQPDDLIVSLTRPHHGSIALLGDEHKGCVASTGFSVIRDVASTTSKRFIWAVLRLSSSLQQMLRRASGGNYPAITQEELGNVLIPLPSLEIQQLVIDEATRRNAEADASEAHAHKTWQQARERFEQQLFKGDNA